MAAIDDIDALVAKVPTNTVQTGQGSNGFETVDSIAASGKIPDQPGMMSLLGKMSDFVYSEFQKTPSLNPFSMPFEKTPADHPLRWENLAPDEKRAAIALGSMFIPSFTGQMLSKLGFTGFMSRLFGYAVDGGLIGGGTQAAGNIVADRPVTEGVKDAATEGAAWDAGGGAVIDKVLPGVSQPARNVMQDRNLLGNPRVAPTPGQVADTGTFLGQAMKYGEEVLQSWLGPFVRGPRAAAGKEFLNETLERANPPGAPRLTGNTQERIGELKDRLGAQYDRAAGMVGDIPRNSPEFGDWYKRVLDSIDNAPISPEMKAQAHDYLSSQLNAYSSYNKNGEFVVTSDNLKKLESNLGNESFARSRVQNTGDAAQQHELGWLYGDAVGSIRDMRGQFSPEARDIYQQTDPLYSELTVFDRAALRHTGDMGDFTPRQGLGAMRHKTNSPKPGGLQEWLQDGAQVFGNTVADSGTAGRLAPWLLAGGTGAGGYGLAAGAISVVPTMLTLAGLGIAGTRAGRIAATGAMDYSQRAAAPMLRDIMSGWHPTLLGQESVQQRDF